MRTNSENSEKINSYEDTFIDSMRSLPKAKESVKENTLVKKKLQGLIEEINALMDSQNKDN